MHIDSWHKTDVGLKRENNQDSFLADPEIGLYIVADGMGGHKGGEVASAMAIEIARRVIREELAKSSFDPAKAIARAYQQAAMEIYERGIKEPNLRGMATTMVLCLMHRDRFFIGNVGDSRAYVVAAPGMWQLTEDHSLFNEQLKAGLIHDMDKHEFEGKNVITRSVGFEVDVNCDVIEKILNPDELILMCSDGLSGLVTDQGIASICLTMGPEKAVDRLVDEAKKNGGDDNVTVVLLRVTEPAPV
jgi:PPM family protein phosphatase